jgi:hypothetical protein
MMAQLKWTDADVGSAHWAYLKHNPWRFIRYFRYPIVAVAVSFIVLIQHPDSWQIVGWLIFFDAGAIAYQLFLSKRNTNRRFKNSRLWQGLVTVTIDGRSIRLSGQGFDVERHWADYSEFFESKRVFMFGRAGSKILFLPKSGMNEPQIVELRTLISTYAKGNVALASSR